MWLLAALIGAATAQAGFAPENDLMGTGPFPEASGIATDSSGDTLVAWSLAEVEGLKARWLSASGQLGQTIEVFGGPAVEPELAAAASGRAFAVWRTSTNSSPNTVLGRWIERDGTLGPLLTLEAADPGKIDAAEARVVVDAAGVATVGWRNQTGGNAKISLKRVHPNSVMDATVRDVGSGTGLRIAALPSGSTVATWRNAGTELNTVTAAGQVGMPQVISSDSSTADPEIGVDPHGNGLVVWRDDSSGTFTMRGARFDPSGNPVGGEIVIDPSAPAVLSSRMSIASDTAGDFLVAWVRYIPPGEGILYARGLDPNGEFRGPPQPVSAPGAVAEDLIGSIIDDRGSGAIVWPDDTNMTQTVMGRTIDSSGVASGTISPVVGVPAGPVFGAAVAALGFAAFLTHQKDDVLVRRFLEPPICSDSQAEVRQGKPIAVPLSCTGPGVETASSAGNPGHGSLGPFDPRTMAFGYTPDPGFEGTDHFTYTAGNDGGGSNAAAVTIRVGKDTVKPRIKRIRFVEGKKRDRFVLRISEPARVAITVVRRGGAAKPSRRAVAGIVKSRRPSTKVVLPVRGKLAKRLREGGRFRATAIATDPARNRSKPKRLAFRT